MLVGQIEALKTLVVRDQSWVNWSTIAVFIGLVGEIMIVFKFSKDKPRSETILSFICGVVIAVGVFGEYGFGSKAAQGNAQLQSISERQVANLNLETANARSAAAIAEQKAGEANDRASANEREAERLGVIAEEERLARAKIEEAVAWRRLTKEQRNDIGNRLKKFSGELALPQYDANDVEEYSFASDIASALHQANWRVFEPLALLSLREGPVPLGTNPPLETGVVIKSTGDQTSRDAARALSQELTLRGFDSTVSPVIDPRRVAEVFVILEHRPEGAQGEAKLRKRKVNTQTD